MIRLKTAYLLLALLALPLAGCSQDAPLDAYFPGQVERFRLDALVTGQEAMDGVDKLHSKAIPTEDAAIGRYVGPGGAMNVWISTASNAAGAREQAAIMVEKMLDAPELPFTDPSHFSMDGVRVQRFEGMGQVHLVFTLENRVYWISCDEAMQDAALDAFLVR